MNHCVVREFRNSKWSNEALKLRRHYKAKFRKMLQIALTALEINNELWGGKYLNKDFNRSLTLQVEFWNENGNSLIFSFQSIQPTCSLVGILLYIILLLKYLVYEIWGHPSTNIFIILHSKQFQTRASPSPRHVVVRGGGLMHWF